MTADKSSNICCHWSSGKSWSGGQC